MLHLRSLGDSAKNLQVSTSHLQRPRKMSTIIPEESRKRPCLAATTPPNSILIVTSLSKTHQLRTSHQRCNSEMEQRPSQLSHRVDSSGAADSSCQTKKIFPYSFRTCRSRNRPNGSFRKLLTPNKLPTRAHIRGPITSKAF